jgi:hypothetical protein
VSRAAIYVYLALCCAAIGCFAHWAATEMRVEKRFGCVFDTPYVGRDDCALEVRAIASVVPDGAFARAGARPGEFVTPSGAPRPADLCELLDELEPGQSIAVPFRMPRKDGCWQDWPERIVTIVAP